MKLASKKQFIFQFFLLSFQWEYKERHFNYFIYLPMKDNAKIQRKYEITKRFENYFIIIKVKILIYFLYILTKKN